MNAPLRPDQMSTASIAPARAAPRRRFAGLPANTSRRELSFALLAIAALHVIVLVALIRAGLIETPRVVQIIQAALVQPPPPEMPPPPAPPKPPQPQRVVKPAPLPPKPAPLLTAAATPSEAPVFVAPPPEPKPELPPIAAPPAPPAPPAPLAPPRFDADYLDNPAPTYPSLARRTGEEGKVMLRVFVEASGKPSKIEVRNSSGSTRLDDAAMNAVWRWKFVPARRGDENVAAWVLVPISFSLRDT